MQSPHVPGKMRASGVRTLIIAFVVCLPIQTSAAPECSTDQAHGIRNNSASVGTAGFARMMERAGGVA